MTNPSNLPGVAARLAAAPIAPADRAVLRTLVLDMLACTVAGAASPGAARLRDAVAGGVAGPCRLFGAENRTAAPQAAFLNGHAGHVLDFDDVHVRSIYHPGVPMIAAVLAVADRNELGAEAVARGILAGYEVGIRLGEAAGKAHYLRHHTTGTVGCVAAAAGVAAALSMTPGAISDAMGHGATQAAALWAFREDGAPSKPVHAGHAAMTGVMSADMAAAGIPGPATAIDGPHGFLATMGGDRASPFLRETSVALRIHAVSLKPYPCCGHTHSGIEAAFDLAGKLTRAGQGAAQVRRITLETYGEALSLASRVRPATPEDAAFSYSHIVATAVLRGDMADAFTTGGLAARDVAALADRVVLVHCKDFDRAYPERQPVRLTAILEDGSTVESYAEFGSGSPQRPMSAALHERKLRDLAGEAFKEIAALADRIAGVAEAVT